MPDAEQKRITVTLSSSEYQQLRQLAFAEETPVAVKARQVIQAYIGQQPAPASSPR